MYISRRMYKTELFLVLISAFSLLIYLYIIHSEISLGGWSTESLLEREYFNDTLLESRVQIKCLSETNDELPSNKSLDISNYWIFEKNYNNWGVVRSKEDKYIRDIGYKQHAFNALVSNNIGLIRPLPDTRHQICDRNATLPNETLPTVSIVMCFYNEHKMTLFRSIKTIIERTPSWILKEIILVDDYSDIPELEFHLQHDLHSHLQYKNIIYIRNDRREGLIRSRVIGAKAAQSDVLIFLDSHIEVNQQWSEPLLRLIQKENSTLAVPVIDLINPDTFAYTSSPLVRGGFNWGLNFVWENIPSTLIKTTEDLKGPFSSPTMAGGLYAVNRLYFLNIGAYDTGMDIWGGENIEISFRVWQCGGAIKIVPCSRVGHVFRKRRPYAAPDGTDTMIKNSLRLANVWMDEYKKFYQNHEKIPENYNYGDITDRLALRKKLKCQNFSWYLKNVYPELKLPGEKVNKTNKTSIYQPWHSRKRNYIKSYLIRLSGTTLCVSVITPKVKGFWKRGSPLILQACTGDRNQMWYETDKQEIILDRLLCMEATGDTEIVINKCHEMMGDQQWSHTKANHSPLYNMATGTCLKALTAEAGSNLSLDICTKQHQANTWDLVITNNSKIT